MLFLLYLCNVFHKQVLKSYRDMNNLLKNIGLVLVLLGVACLVVYETSVQTNILLVVALVLEVIGILAYIVLNRSLK